MNRVELIGNITKDIELKKAGEVSVAKFSIAINRNYKNDKGEHDTDFVQVTAWRNLAENVGKFCKKGDKVAVMGSINTGSYEKDGKTHYTTEIVADEVEFLSPKNTKEEK